MNRKNSDHELNEERDNIDSLCLESIPVIFRNIGSIYLKDDVGFSRVPDQIRRESITSGFSLNLMVVGRRGLGTTTLINSIFSAAIVSSKRDNGITIFKNDLYEYDICLKVSVITYHEEDINQALEYIEDKNVIYLGNENMFKKKSPDPRVHACLYLIPSDRLSSREIEGMAELSDKCNLIPVITKSDMFTPEELINYKKNINELLTQNNISIFKPAASLGDDEEYLREVRSITERYPLAIVAGETPFERGNQKLKGRVYPWGAISLEDEDYNDFTKLRKLLVYNHLDDLIYTTNTIFYNKFRNEAKENKKCIEIKNEELERLRKHMDKLLRERHAIKVQDLKKKIEILENEIAMKVKRNDINNENQ
ncbi:Cell division control protein 10 [Astathelohania contejeani]|uniref:Cell division control protein 10 n=1 Tax=Astathelohania contejeani TaxID=164912 RepID=A0ABQ7HWR1_9MICR|nr:Cell division control protein 10 [Thelohania contejeani]